MPYLVIIRHGQSEYNLQNRFTGQLDISLSDYGRKEAKVSGRKLRKKHLIFDNIFTSGLRRAHETLDLILEELRIPKNQVLVVQSSALNERNYGGLQGLNKTEAAAKYSEKKFIRGGEGLPPGHPEEKALKVPTNGLSRTTKRVLSPC
ncbi:MAG: 2,3-bisphosphoglycerate-dependent phosphoglycerate mutase [Cyclobacteriaceae bacterium]